MNKGKRDFFNSPAVPKYSITNNWDNNGTGDAGLTIRVHAR